MRDLKADLELCNKATPGPWEVVPGTNSVSSPYPRGYNKPQANMMFIAQSREGWPHAIKRALKAEADFKRQEEYSDMLEDERNELYNLARELVEALEEALLLTTIFMHTDESDLMKTECEMVLAKAKEVLGDGDHQRQGG